MPLHCLFTVAKGWEVWGSNLGGGEIICTGRDRPHDPSGLLYKSYPVNYQSVRRSEGGVNHPIPLRADVKKEDNCTSTSPLYLHAITLHYFTLHYLLIPRCKVLLEQLTGLQLVKKFPAFHGTRRFITALTSVRHLSLLYSTLLTFHCNTFRPTRPLSDRTKIIYL